MKKTILRELTLNDTKDFLKCLDNPELKDILPSLYTTSEEVARIILNVLIDENQRKERLCFGLKEQEEPKKDKIIGVILSKRKQETADLICLINPQYQGKGYASKGLKEAMKLLHRKDRKIKNFRMLIEDKNEKGKKLAMRLGFEDKGMSKEIPELSEYKREVKVVKNKEKGER